MTGFMTTLLKVGVGFIAGAIAAEGTAVAGNAAADDLEELARRLRAWARGPEPEPKGFFAKRKWRKEMERRGGRRW